jgi:magnesium chelatase family protein
VGLTGGGAIPKPGEISLAHNGVLFLDELPEFQKKTLEILRQPMEEHEIHLVRQKGSVSYPANFLLLAAMNPCNCGYYPDMQKCRCTQQSLRRYFDKVSQPLLDRIDICVEAPTVSYRELTEKGKGESSKEIQKRVLACHQIQCERFQGEHFYHNSQIPAARLDEFCFLEAPEQQYMERIYHRMSLTARTYHKVLRVARTIADLEEANKISVHHLNEAICYRNVDEKFWGGEA